MTVTEKIYVKVLTHSTYLQVEIDEICPRLGVSQLCKADRGEVVECFITSPNTKGTVSTPDMGSLHVTCSCIMNIVFSANYIYCSAWQCAVGTWAASFVATSIRKGFLPQLASHTAGVLGGFKNYRYFVFLHLYYIIQVLSIIISLGA